MLLRLFDSIVNFMEEMSFPTIGASSTGEVPFPDYLTFNIFNNEIDIGRTILFISYDKSEFLFDENKESVEGVRLFFMNWNTIYNIKQINNEDK